MNVFYNWGFLKLIYENFNLIIDICIKLVINIYDILFDKMCDMTTDE